MFQRCIHDQVICCRLSELPFTGRKRGINAVQRTECTGHAIELHGVAEAFEDGAFEDGIPGCGLHTIESWSVAQSWLI